MNLNFLLQATRVLSVNNYDEDELIMIFNFMTAIPYRGTVVEIIVESSYNFVDKFLGLNGQLGIKF